MFKLFSKLFNRTTDEASLQGFSVKEVTTQDQPTALLPPRISSSLEDSLSAQASEAYQMGDINEVKISSTWKDFFKKRPADIPYFDAYQGDPFIAVVISRENVPGLEIIKQTLLSGRDPGLHVQAYLEGGYPIIRSVFCFKDNPLDPLYLEAPLCIEDGSIQEFYNAIDGSEKINIIISHVSDLDHQAGVSCMIPNRLRESIKEQFDTVIDSFTNLRPGGTFQESVKSMELTFASATDGVELNHMVDMPINGPATLQVLEFHSKEGVREFLETNTSNKTPSGIEQDSFSELIINNLEQTDETRGWEKIAELKNATDYYPNRPGQIDEVLNVSRELIERFPDFDLPRLWHITALLDQNRKQEACDSLVEGVLTCNRKSEILGCFAQTLFWSQTIETADDFMHLFVSSLAACQLNSGMYFGRCFLAAYLDHYQLAHPDFISELKNCGVSFDNSTMSRINRLVLTYPPDGEIGKCIDIRNVMKSFIETNSSSGL